MNKGDLHSSSILIIKDFQLAPDSLSIPENELSYDSLLIKLTKLIDYLMANDFNKLINVLYRIDISEEKLKGALSQSSENTAKLIAEMILEREIQKVETRKRYS